MSLEVQTRTLVRPADSSNDGRRTTVRSLIIDYLASNGASKVADISA